MNELKQAIISQLQLLPPASQIEPNWHLRNDQFGDPISQVHCWLNWHQQRLLLLLEIRYNHFTQKWYLNWLKPDFQLASLQVLDLTACELLYQLLKQPALTLSAPKTALAELKPHVLQIMPTKNWPKAMSTKTAQPAHEFIAALTAFLAQTAAICSFEQLVLPMQIVFEELVYRDDYVKIDLAVSDPKSTYILAMLLDTENLLIFNLEQIDKPAKCSHLLKQTTTQLSGDFLLLLKQLMQLSDAELNTVNLSLVK